MALMHHSHTGRHRPHRHTSYPALGFLLLVATFITGSVTSRTLAEDIGVIATVPEPPPSQAAVIVTPNNNDRFTTNPVTVAGTCPAGTLVKVFTNNVFAGAAICNSGGAFNIPIDLFIGRNELVARVYNAIDQPGPDSNTVIVFYDLPGFAGPPETAFRILASNLYRGTFVGQEVTWTATIVGGTAPYAISWDWGDGRSEPYSRSKAGEFSVKHVYSQPGPNNKNSYLIKIQGIDSNDQKAFLQLVTIVNPDGGTIGGIRRGGGWLAIAWPLLIVAILLVLAFYLGERREKKIMERRAQQAIPPPALPPATV